MKITLEEGLKIVRWLELQLIPRKAHCALAGSVLHKGESEKDLDIIVYPHNEHKNKTSEQIENLEKIIKEIFPESWLVTNMDYPADRLLYRVHTYGVRIELFIFL